MQNWLTIQNLSIFIEGKSVVEKIGLTIKPREIHVLMGPNGSGKSSLALALMGHPNFRIKEGKVIIGNRDILSLKPNERAKMGLFLSFQNPIAIPGVTLGQLIFTACKNTNDNKVDINKLYLQIKRKAQLLGFSEDILNRDINDGFSGGEKKKAEILMLLNLKPKFVIFDEIDSGLDIDALKTVSQLIKELAKKGVGIILITHSQEILNHIKPKFIHIIKNGNIIQSGNIKLAKEIGKKGYAKV